MIFVLTWIFSGWLSMDADRLFSTGALTAEEAGRSTARRRGIFAGHEWRSASVAIKEIEWFVFNRKFCQRENERARRAAPVYWTTQYHRAPTAISRISGYPQSVRLSKASGWRTLIIVAAPSGNCGISSLMPCRSYRSVCRDIWYQITSGASGWSSILERLDPSRRGFSIAGSTARYTRWIFLC